jgi:hypothetical protein
LFRISGTRHSRKPLLHFFLEILLKAKEWRILRNAGDRRQETGDRRQETGDRRQETGDRRQETGDRRQETGDRRQESGVTRQECTGRSVTVEAHKLSPFISVG